MAKALKPQIDPLNRNGLNLTIAIYWHPRTGPDAITSGHSALIINADRWLDPNGTGQFSPLDCLADNEWYVSWLGGKIDWTPGCGSWGGNKGVYNDFQDDMRRWGGEQAGTSVDKKFPIRWVAIQGLNTDAMRNTWAAARNKQGAHWNLFSKNCATMVHTILKAGGGNQFATGHKKQLLWWPSDIIRYAKSMTGHVYLKSSSPAAAFQ